MANNAPYENPKPEEESAKIKLVNFIYEPDDKGLLSVARLRNSREALLLSIQIAKEAALDPARFIRNEKGEVIGYTPVSKIWRRAFLLLTRSVDSKGFFMGIGLAREQTEQETEAAEEADI